MALWPGGCGGSEGDGTPPRCHLARGPGLRTCIPGEPQPRHPRRDPALAVFCTASAVTLSLRIQFLLIGIAKARLHQTLFSGDTQPRCQRGG